MAKDPKIGGIGQQGTPPGAAARPWSLWPGGGVRSVREKLGDPTQFEKKRRKRGDPRTPSLASHELLEFMGTGHSSEELRLPLPPTPYGDGEGAEPTYFPDRAFTRSAIDRGSSNLKQGLETALSRINVAPDKLDRMRAIIQREAQMIALASKVQDQVDEIIEKMKVEHKANGSY